MSVYRRNPSAALRTSRFVDMLIYIAQHPGCSLHDYASARSIDPDQGLHAYHRALVHSGLLELRGYRPISGPGGPYKLWSITAQGLTFLQTYRTTHQQIIDEIAKVA
jgi:hypothetical protein